MCGPAEEGALGASWSLSVTGGSGKVNLVPLLCMEAEWGGVGWEEVTTTAGELGVEELQLEVLEEESG